MASLYVFPELSGELSLAMEELHAKLCRGRHGVDLDSAFRRLKANAPHIREDSEKFAGIVAELFDSEEDTETWLATVLAWHCGTILLPEHVNEVLAPSMSAALAESSNPNVIKRACSALAWMSIYMEPEVAAAAMRAVETHAEHDAFPLEALPFFGKHLNAERRNSALKLAEQIFDKFNQDGRIDVGSALPSLRQLAIFLWASHQAIVTMGDDADGCEHIFTMVCQLIDLWKVSLVAAHAIETGTMQVEVDRYSQAHCAAVALCVTAASALQLPKLQSDLTNNILPLLTVGDAVVTSCSAMSIALTREIRGQSLGEVVLETLEQAAIRATEVRPGHGTHEWSEQTHNLLLPLACTERFMLATASEFEPLITRCQDPVFRYFIARTWKSLRDSESGT